MTVDQIERDIFIAAPPERVWPLVAEPGFWATTPAAGSGASARSRPGPRNRRP